MVVCARAWSGVRRGLGKLSVRSKAGECKAQPQHSPNPPQAWVTGTPKQSWLHTHVLGLCCPSLPAQSGSFLAARLDVQGTLRPLTTALQGAKTLDCEKKPQQLTQPLPGNVTVKTSPGRPVLPPLASVLPVSSRSPSPPSGPAVDGQWLPVRPWGIKSVWVSRSSSSTAALPGLSVKPWRAGAAGDWAGELCTGGLALEEASSEVAQTLHRFKTETGAGNSGGPGQVLGV